jgi:shikimate dehydrogenase
MSRDTKRVAIVGDPVEHSLSPVMQNTAFASAGLDWEMVRLQVAAGGGAGVIGRVRAGEFAGLAITMPLKEEAANAVDELDPASERLRSVNTAVALQSGSVLGMSTDGDGFVRSLYACDVELINRKVHVVGAGGAARSIIAALGAIDGCSITVSNRTFSAAVATAGLVDGAQAVGEEDVADAVRSADVVVNTTSVGMGLDQNIGAVPLPVELISQRHVVADIVYHPLTTALLASAGARGATTVDGLGMLVHQAVLQCEAWTGFSPDPLKMRVAAEAELSRRSG